MLTISEAAQVLDLSVDTLRRWDKGGLIRSTRSAQNHRLFDLDEIRRVHAKREARHTSEPNFKVYKDEQTEFTVIDLFAGGGGTALGLDNAGFKHVLLNEFDAKACETLRSNRKDWNVVEGDVAEIGFSEYNGKVDLVEGGFPCQAFSYAGRGKGFADTRGTLFYQWARAVREVMPKIAIAENVRGLVAHDEGRTLEAMVKEIKSIKDDKGRTYRLAMKVLKAQYFDVSQKRERLFMVLVRSDIETEILFPKERDYIVSLWESIGDCPPSDGARYADWKFEIMDKVPEGGYWRDLDLETQKQYLKGSFHLTGGKTGMARRLSWAEPSLTLTCNPAQKQTERCHPEETRPLNVREYARIQTFPDDWEFSGGMSAAYKQIGNAVPVNLAYHLGRAVKAMLDPTNYLDDSFEVAEEI
ncbi:MULTISPECIES: DNA (cytosine-5-)-methyltransferase [unclassified Arthrobacter]|uniref:DNA (cytosine-5-)-methyltransferase n=1 Tax=unclassified Arthrobacter TaxID=235627 RepID=UPI001C615C47|nr:MULTISPECIES: DNA (cytosine-5-)-methyltransferase [unclassified Arthrobacter]